jgi:phosphoribosylglycinamide formyltransferase 1
VIGVLVSGEGSNLQALLDSGLPIAAVASNRAGARALERAERAGVATGVFELEAFASRDDRDAEMADWLAARGVDLVVCAGYMHLLRPVFLSRFPGRVVNTHSAPLPDFPGAHPVEDVLAAGVPETAATVHYVDEGVDSGLVIAVERVPVRRDDTLVTLKERVQAAEHRLLPRVVRELIVSRPWPASANAGRSPAPPTPGAAARSQTRRSAPVSANIVPSGIAPPAAPQSREVS